MDKFKRDEDGLIVGVNYIRNADGTINWRAMINPAHLVFNKQYEKTIVKKYGDVPFASLKVSDVGVDNVSDRDVLILLPGIKELAKLRGYTKVIPHVDLALDNRCVVTTQITWIGNFETNGETVEFGDVGSASIINTSDFGKMFLEPIAANRAFVRAVRNFLGVHIVGQDEVKLDGPATNQPQTAEAEHSEQVSGTLSIVETLQNAASAHSLSDFEKFRARIIEKHKPIITSDPETWSSWSDIPVKDVYRLLDKMKSSGKK